MLVLLMTALGAEPVALVELFTSEGCSSCPPADSLLTEIVSEAKTDGHAVVGLSFHVDYWDRLGWTDPYGDARWTSRQRDYAKQFGSRRVYTPQVIVNGTREAVGSDAPKVKGLIAGALAESPRATVKGKARVKTDSVEVTLSVKATSGRVFVAVIEPERKGSVLKGENAGKALVHSNVVRALTEAETGKSQLEVSVPPDVDLDHAEVVVWVQDSATNAVMGAVRLPIEAG